MPQSILIFDFGSDESAAQLARHKLEGWKQAFRLGNRILLKFDRAELTEKSPDPNASPARSAPEEKKRAKKKPAGKNEKDDDPPASPARVQLLVRLAFSDHEKLSHQRWLDRIPSEEPFKSVKSEAIRASDPLFAQTSERFESLD